MQLRDHTDVSSRAFVDRNDRLHANLEIFSRPDNARIDRAGRLSTRAAVQRSFERELHQRNQPITRRRQVHVLHLRLQIDHAVLQRKTPLQHVRMSLDLNLAFAGPIIDRHTARARARGNLDAGQPRDGERFQEPQHIGQIAKALTEKNPRCPGTE